MSEEIAAVLRRMTEAFNAEGIDAALEYFDPDLQWWAPPEWLEERLYTGHDGIRRLADYWTQQFDGYRLEIEEISDLDDDRVLALYHQQGIIKGSRTPIEQPVGWVVRGHNGKIAEVHVYFSWHAASEAAGLSQER